MNATEPPTSEQVAVERERIRTEFFATYDAMTGVRIATTLGGFFGLMVFLVIYKSRGERIETENALKVSDAKVGNKTKHWTNLIFCGLKIIKSPSNYQKTIRPKFGPSEILGNSFLELNDNMHFSSFRFHFHQGPQNRCRCCGRNARGRGS